MIENVLTEITNSCEECHCRECCLEEECVLYRIEQIVLNKNKIKIRKLTPKECWRLMGFDDEDFYKAKNAGISDTQLYKQAGNSIVVNVLEAIFKNLLLGDGIKKC